MGGSNDVDLKEATSREMLECWYSHNHDKEQDVTRSAM